MSVMNDAQESLLSSIEEARKKYEAWEAGLAQEMADRKWEAKKEIRKLVREARNIEVPYRRIGMALNTSDHATIRSYEQDRRRG